MKNLYFSESQLVFQDNRASQVDEKKGVQQVAGCTPLLFKPSVKGTPFLGSEKLDPSTFLRAARHSVHPKGFQRLRNEFFHRTGRAVPIPSCTVQHSRGASKADPEPIESIPMRYGLNSRANSTRLQRRSREPRRRSCVGLAQVSQDRPTK